MAKTKVVEPAGWPSVSTTYAKITKKLQDPNASAANKQAAINYWMQRLLEDAASIAASTGPLTN